MQDDAFVSDPTPIQPPHMSISNVVCFEDDDAESIIQQGVENKKKWNTSFLLSGLSSRQVSSRADLEFDDDISESESSEHSSECSSEESIIPEGEFEC